LVLFEWPLIAVALALGVRALGLRDRHAAPLMALMILAGAAAALVTAFADQPAAPRPIAMDHEGFVTSNACRSCHPAEYSSWHASYHRTMTQSATLASVGANELRQGSRLHVETSGRTVELFTDREQLWARLPDPGVTSAAAPEAYEASFRSAPIRDVPIQLLTGSHHQQAFWVAGARAGELRALPVVYLVAERRLIARRDAFLNPPDPSEHAVRWN
jgi:hypothetical protein